MFQRQTQRFADRAAGIDGDPPARHRTHPGLQLCCNGFRRGIRSVVVPFCHARHESVAISLEPEPVKRDAQGDGSCFNVAPLLLSCIDGIDND